MRSSILIAVLLVLAPMSSFLLVVLMSMNMACLPFKNWNGVYWTANIFRMIKKIFDSLISRGLVCFTKLLKVT